MKFRSIECRFCLAIRVELADVDINKHGQVVMPIATDPCPHLHLLLKNKTRSSRSRRDPQVVASENKVDARRMIIPSSPKRLVPPRGGRWPPPLSI